MSQKYETKVRRRQHKRQKTVNFLALALLFLIPVYPAFGSYMQVYTGAIVRGDIDTSSILSSYDDETWQATYIEEYQDIDDPIGQPLSLPLQTPSPGPRPGTPPQATPKKDPKTVLYITHTVRPGDTISTIAYRYWLNSAALRESNGLPTDRLSIGQRLTIPRINGIKYTVKKGDTYTALAMTYGVRDVTHIFLANDLKNGAPVAVGREIIIPNPTRDPAKPANPQKPDPRKPDPKKPNPPIAQKPAQKKPAQKLDPKSITYGDYTLNLKVSKWCRNFAWGNCTCFVAKYKDVTWRGNAKDWLRNAQKKGVPTGKTPRPGAIIVYQGYGYPPAYGHVGIVMEVNEDHMIIKDMNYRALNEVTTRKESFDHPAIRGYVYVD
jgi:surface antigen